MVDETVNIKIKYYVDDAGKMHQETTKTIKKMKEFGKYEIKQYKNNKLVTKTTKDETKSFKQMYRSALPLIFAGKWLQQTTAGLLKPALDATGIFDVFNATLVALFTNALMPLVDILIGIMAWFMGLPDWAKTAITALVLIIAAFGMLMMGIGLFQNLAFALGTFMSLLGVVGAAAGPVIAGIIAALSPLLLPILAIIAVIALLWFAWQTNFGNIRQHAEQIINGIKQIFSGFVNFIKGIFDIILGIITLNPEKVKEGWNLIKQAIMQIVGGFVDIGKGIIGFIVDGIKQAGHLIWDTLTGLPVIGTVIKTIGEGIVSGATAIAGAIGGFAKSIGMAEGGIVTQPTMALIGERGPEAVVPLSGGGAGGMDYHPTINISATVSGDYDIRKIADRLDAELREKLRGLGR